MARIQITDLNPSEVGLTELTDEELMAINGGGWFTDFLRGLADTIDAIFGV